MNSVENFIKLGGLYSDQNWFHILFIKRLEQDIEPDDAHFNAIVTINGAYSARKAREMVRKLSGPTYSLNYLSNEPDWIQRWEVEILSLNSLILVCDYRVKKHHNQLKIIAKVIANNKIGWVYYGSIYNAGPPLNDALILETSFDLLPKINESSK